MTDSELRWMCRAATRDFPGPRGDRPPRWITDLASLPVPPFHALDLLMHAGLVAWRDGWRVTDAGWHALRTEAPEDLEV